MTCVVDPITKQLQWVQVWENGTRVAVPAYTVPLPPEAYLPLLAAVAMAVAYVWLGLRWRLFDPWRGDYLVNILLGVVYTVGGVLTLNMSAYVYTTLDCSGDKYTTVVANPYAASGYVPLALGIVSTVLAVAQALGELVE